MSTRFRRRVSRLAARRRHRHLHPRLERMVRAMSTRRAYIDDDGNLVDLHDAYVCVACEVVYAFTDTPTRMTACDACGKSEGWVYVK